MMMMRTWPRSSSQGTRCIIKPEMIKVKRTYFLQFGTNLLEGWTHVDATEVFGGREMNNEPLEMKGMKIAKLVT